MKTGDTIVKKDTCDRNGFVNPYSIIKYVHRIDDDELFLNDDGRIYGPFSLCKINQHYRIVSNVEMLLFTNFRMSNENW